MRILVDGYNLAHASGILARNIGPGTLRRAREGLIGFLAGALSEAERADTTVVFDAGAPPADSSLDDVSLGLTILYARDHATADALIEEMIRADSAPRQLVVVTSDRRIQQAARRRKAKVIDSETWYADLRRRRHEDLRTKADRPEKPDAPSSESEVDYWLEVFGEDET